MEPVDKLRTVRYPMGLTGAFSVKNTMLLICKEDVKVLLSRLKTAKSISLLIAKQLLHRKYKVVCLAPLCITLIQLHFHNALDYLILSKSIASFLKANQQHAQSANLATF